MWIAAITSPFLRGYGNAMADLSHKDDSDGRAYPQHGNCIDGNTYGHYRATYSFSLSLSIFHPLSSLSSPFLSFALSFSHVSTCFRRPRGVTHALRAPYQSLALSLLSPSLLHSLRLCCSFLSLFFPIQGVSFHSPIPIAKFGVNFSKFDGVEIM